MSKAFKREKPMHSYIFFTNILRLLDERSMTKSELADLSGVSVSFLSDLTTGKANPSLRVMEAIAAALEMPLPVMLERTDLSQEDLATLAENKAHRVLPRGYEWVTAVLPEQKAFVVRKWSEETKKKIKALA